MKRLVLIAAASAVLALIPHPAAPQTAPSHTGDPRVDAIIDCVDFRKPLVLVEETAEHTSIRALEPGITVAMLKQRPIEVAYKGASLATIFHDETGNLVVRAAAIFSEGDPANGGVGRIFLVREGERCASALPVRDMTFRAAKPL